jgi:hypothetical protein
VHGRHIGGVLAKSSAGRTSRRIEREGRLRVRFGRANRVVADIRARHLLQRGLDNRASTIDQLGFCAKINVQSSLLDCHPEETSSNGSSTSVCFTNGAESATPSGGPDRRPAPDPPDPEMAEGGRHGLRCFSGATAHASLKPPIQVQRPSTGVCDLWLV